MSSFPALDGDDDDLLGGSNVRVTGVSGTGEDEDRAQFESAFPDLSSEVGYEAVSIFSPLVLLSASHRFVRLYTLQIPSSNR